MQRIKHVVISAAGLGSRLGMDIPKCLLQIRGKALIDHQMELLRDVPDVRIVVGFKEFEVMNHVNKNWPNVTFVRNPDYAHTSNTHSLFLATKDLKEPFVAVDGDLLIRPSSFYAFLHQCAIAPTSIVGIAKRTSEDAVGVDLDAAGDVARFVRAGQPGYEVTESEWCGIAYVKAMRLNTNQKYVFEELALHLPLPSCEIECAEIDTARDFEYARRMADEYFRSSEHGDVQGILR